MARRVAANLWGITPHVACGRSVPRKVREQCTFDCAGTHPHLPEEYGYAEELVLHELVDVATLNASTMAVAAELLGE